MARVLIMEGHNQLLSLLAAAMRQAGYDVLSVADPRTALAHLGAASRVLIVDLAPPEAEAVALVREALRRHPELLRVFVISSVCDPTEVLRELPDPRVRVLLRPFSPSQLLREVGQTVTDAAPGQRGRSPRPSTTRSVGGVI